MKFWIGVASREHVKIGEKEGFCQLCHGKKSPLKKMKKGDWIIYYSSKNKMNDTSPYQKFTALGRMKSDEVYQIEMTPTFTPFRKNVDFMNITEIDIKPIIEELSFIQNKSKWGYPFRYGYLEISKDDFLKIINLMLEERIYNQIRDEVGWEQHSY